MITVSRICSDSAETVELTVSKTPPARKMSLRSTSQSKQTDDVADKSKDTDTSKDKTNGCKCKKNRKQKHSVTFTLPNQCNVHKNMVDKNCDKLKIKNKQCEGDDQLKANSTNPTSSMGMKIKFLRLKKFLIFAFYVHQKNTCMTSGT